jgi:hypothetical protein
MVAFGVESLCWQSFGTARRGRYWLAPKELLNVRDTGPTIFSFKAATQVDFVLDVRVKNHGFAKQLRLRLVDERPHACRKLLKREAHLTVQPLVSP